MNEFEKKHLRFNDPVEVLYTIKSDHPGKLGCHKGEQLAFQALDKKGYWVQCKNSRGVTAHVPVSALKVVQPPLPNCDYEGLAQLQDSAPSLPPRGIAASPTGLESAAKPLLPPKLPQQTQFFPADPVRPPVGATGPSVYESPHDGLSAMSLYESPLQLYKVTVENTSPYNDFLQAAVGDIVETVPHSTRPPSEQMNGYAMQVRNLCTGETGWIAENNLIPADDLDQKPWFVDAISRPRAESILMDPHVPRDAFLVRKSEKAGGYVISYKDGSTGPNAVRHRSVGTRGHLYFAWAPIESESIEGLIELHLTSPGHQVLGQPHNKFAPGCSPSLTSAPPPQLYQYKPEPADGSVGQIYQSESNQSSHNIYGTGGMAQPPRSVMNRTSSASGSDSGGSKDKWFISPKNIEKRETLGSGHYGSVFRAVLRINNKDEDVAVKTFNSHNMSHEEFTNEAQAMKDLRHPNLVRLYGISQLATSDICLVMQYHPNKSLVDYCKTRQIDLTAGQRGIIARNVASGMRYLTEQKYIHRDLAARNVLVRTDLTACIADFGLAKLMKDGPEHRLDGRMPWKWSAPEVIGQNRDWTTKCDVWSYGVFCWELYTDCAEPYGNKLSSSKELIAKLKTGFRLGRPLKCDSNFYEKVLRMCWEMKPESRISFGKIENMFNNHSF